MTTLEGTKLKKIIAPSFYPVHRSISAYTHFRLYGGRGSCKSSFVSVEIVLGIMENPDTNAVILRKVADTIRTSVFAQIEWAIEKLGVSAMWEAKPSLNEIVYLKTGQRILFRGADKPQKLKSVKVSRGYVRYIWFEELDEFHGMREIRSINQSLMRGGKKFTVFYTYNPPDNRRSWVNRDENFKRADMLNHKSVYLDVPVEWLGEQFFLEAEYLKKTHPNRYRHEYLGEATGTGGEVFDNIEVRAVTAEERRVFDNIRCGIDFGYAADPFVYVVCYIHNDILYILDEIYARGMTNQNAAARIMEMEYKNRMIVCDSAEPKSINDLRRYGLRVRGAKKGPDSIEYGIRFLQGLRKIIIDGGKCRNCAREFSEYELMRDKNGEFRSEYPDKENHTIDAVRYALEDEINNRRAIIIKRKELDL